MKKNRRKQGSTPGRWLEERLIFWMILKVQISKAKIGNEIISNHKICVHPVKQNEELEDNLQKQGRY